jgi:hypothetical protein
MIVALCVTSSRPSRQGNIRANVARDAPGGGGGCSRCLFREVGEDTQAGVGTTSSVLGPKGHLTCTVRPAFVVVARGLTGRG